MESHKSKSMIELLKSQSLNMAKESHMARRWSKEVISFCMTIWTTSPKAYRQLSEFLLLPTERLLQYYKNVVKQAPGFLNDMFQWMHHESVRLSLLPHGLEGGIIVDEMKIQEDLQISKEGSDMKLR